MDIIISNDLKNKIDVMLEPCADGRILNAGEETKIILNEKKCRGELYINICTNEQTGGYIFSLWDNDNKYDFETFEFKESN